VQYVELQLLQNTMYLPQMQHRLDFPASVFGRGFFKCGDASIRLFGAVSKSPLLGDPDGELDSDVGGLFCSRGITTGEELGEDDNELSLAEPDLFLL
jgi:hypothetical protein